MKNMLSHSFVLDCLETTGADTFTHFEVLIDEHRRLVELEGNNGRPSRLKQLVPTVGTFHTRLPLRQAFELYNAKHRLTKRKHIQISFNEVRSAGWIVVVETVV
jgi:IMP and pyridine-specific 5'-nucleotidase